MAELVVSYTCGCDAGEVGQAFANGLMVCPTHNEPTAPFEREPRACKGRITIELDLEVRDRHQGSLWVNTLEETLLRDDKVRYVQTVEAYT